MHETGVDDATMLTELAAAPMAPKRRQRRKLHEAQMSFDFDAVGEDGIGDDVATEIAAAAGSEPNVEVKISGSRRSEIPTSPKDETKRLPVGQTFTSARRWGSARRNLPPLLPIRTGTSGAPRDRHSERRNGTRDPP